VRAWAALRASSVASRFEAFHASGLTELVGRKEELEILLRRWSKATSGEGQVVLLSGEAGIGKSRLTAALLENIADKPHRRLAYFCSPQHTDSAFYPISGQIFIEEMTKAVVEAKTEGDARKTAAAIASPALAVPASLHASLMARLDRLGPAREVAQIGAAIGREFSHALLSAVVRKTESELASALGRLIATGLLLRQGSPPYASYLFKHALVQDAAYGTLLRELKRALHARITKLLPRSSKRWACGPTKKAH
jgi:predicted ATPase